MESLEVLFRRLPANLQQEVSDFIGFLLEREHQRQGRTLRQDWAGALRDYRKKYTALELQKKALEWRGD
ncbi:MAG: hypothetical protein CO064_05020 [Anaerolineae bacterium CG_4_9_14_0_8_um_filter_58_9]|nr:MAG: hypothetical protein CO064_05020 [Anaerolineae bacterium CG_4_9_14_0_8_um_filter_58_9]